MRYNSVYMETKKTGDIQAEALALVESEVTKYKDGEYFITENVSVAMRPLIRLLRKNYWGIFDQPVDPITGRQKVWIPLTRLIVDSVRKHADLDLKDLNFRARSFDGIKFTSLVRGFVRSWLYKNYFGEVLDESILQMCIDGTTIWKTYTTTENGKLVVKRRTVDLLNTFIDPTANSIQEAQRFTERSLMAPNDVEAMDGWLNTKNINTAGNLHRVEIDTRNADSTGDFVDVYELWGLIPERLIDGGTSAKLVEGHIVISGIETGDRRVHLIERNTTKDNYGCVIKPYEEMRYMKVPGRWAGVGPAEMVLKLQEWVNTIVNLRITKNTNASLGLFKIRASAGITQQMLSNLVSRGVIKLNNLDDMDNMRIDEAGEGSYRDEDVAKNWAFSVTSTYDIARGESLPASSTATSAVIEDRNSKTAFTLVIESIGHFLNRWMDRHFLPNVPKMMKQAKSVTLYGDFDDIDDLREKVVSYLAMQELDELYKQGIVPSQQEIMLAMQDAEAKLRKNKNLFFDVVEDIVTDAIETEAIFTNETTDVAVTVKNLTDMANLLPDNPEARNSFLASAMDLLGLEVPESLRAPIAAPMQQQGALPGGMPMEAPEMAETTPTEQNLTTQANIL